jgi:hypothetical protein
LPSCNSRSVLAPSSTMPAAAATVVVMVDSGMWESCKQVPITQRRCALDTSVTHRNPPHSVGYMWWAKQHSHQCNTAPLTPLHACMLAALIWRRALCQAACCMHANSRHATHQPCCTSGALDPQASCTALRHQHACTNQIPSSRVQLSHTPPRAPLTGQPGSSSGAHA